MFYNRMGLSTRKSSHRPDENDNPQQSEEESRQERQLRRERARREKYDEEVRNPGDAEAGSDSPIAELGSLDRFLVPVNLGATMECAASL